MNITVILPIHEISPETATLVNRAIESYELAKTDTTELLVVTTDDVLNFDVDGTKMSDKLKSAGYKVIVENDNTSFSHLINVGVSNSDKEYFSILEFDDVYTKNVFKNAEKYASAGFEASVYIPLTEIVNSEDGESYGYINEALLASSFSEELNYLDFNCIEDYPNMNYTGAIFNTKDFIAAGKLKESMKLHFWHEYILRALNLTHKMFVIPKVGYKHTVNRVGSFFDTVKTTMKQEECFWWFDLAKKEYFFKTDRKKTYEE